MKNQSEGRYQHTFLAFLLSNSVSFCDIGNTQNNVKQNEKFYEAKKIPKIIPIITSFLRKIDIYMNNPTRPVASFWGPLTNFSVNDEVTRFDGIQL